MDVHTTAQPPCRGVIEDMRSEQPEVGTRFQRDVLRSVMVCQHDQGDEVVRLADERARAFRFVRPARLVCIQIELIKGTQTTIFAHCLIPSHRLSGHALPSNLLLDALLGGETVGAPRPHGRVRTATT